jgi:hypothetical protein
LAASSQPTQFFDLRYSPPAGVMRRRFVSVLHLGQIADRITALACSADVFVGVALRDRARGDKTAISGSHLLYIESDDPSAGERLERFACQPSMVVASGSPGHLHIYWRLCEHASIGEVESANRRLALGLHGEPGCADIVRMLRPPGSLNHKHTPPVPVRLLEHHAGARYTLAELLAALPSDSKPTHTVPVRPTRGRLGRTALDRELLAIPAAEYVRVLTGREPNHAGKVLCPFHQETNPSLQLYPDGTFYCFGARCKRGGSIFDFAAALWATSTRQQDFLKLRRRLAATFGITPRPTENPDVSKAARSIGWRRNHDEVRSRQHSRSATV